MTQEINSHICLIILQEVQGGDAEQMAVISKKADQQLKQTRDILPESCHHFSTHWIRQDKGSPTGGPNAHSSL